MMAPIRLLAMALALASSTARSSHPFESARNQYEARQDRPQPLLAEATDRPELTKKLAPGKATAFDLQVGCGDGLIREQLRSETDKDKLARRRRRRSYSPWSGQVSYPVPYQSISVWKPPVYQLSRPYYVPIFGAAGRPPIYFPPQPLLINPGVPKDNPVRKFQGPPYLPPREPTTETTMTIDDRFNGGDNEDDRPIWDLGNANEVTQRPSTTTAVIPTRRTRPPGVSKTHPPLIHGPSNSQSSSDSQNSPEVAFTPPPPPSTARAPSASSPNEPSRCVWAIISCCSTTNQISYDCFEQRGCPGAFWDDNPCDSDFAKAAIAAALNYYESK